VLGWTHRVKFAGLVREMVDEDCRALGIKSTGAGVKPGNADQ
jgi:hypothetical protein